MGKIVKMGHHTLFSVPGMLKYAHKINIANLCLDKTAQRSIIIILLQLNVYFIIIKIFVF